MSRIERLTASVLGTALLVGCTAAGPSDPPGPPGPPGPDPLARCAQPGSWQRLPPSPIAGRANAGVVWTGHEMVVWGGTQGGSRPLDDGAAYDPARRAWRVLPSTPLLGRDGHVMVWTGSEVMFWGGNGIDERWDAYDDGGRLQLGGAAGVWKPVEGSHLVQRDDARGVWTGREMLVWGGRDDREQLADGGRYDPATGAWAHISPVGAPEPREDHVAIWTGREMIVWGGWNGPSDVRNYALHGGRYDPETDTWRPISTIGAPEPREDATAIWTGREMIVWGGVRRDGDPLFRRRLDTGGRYDPETDTWQPISMEGAPSPREDHVAVWAGDEMIVWGGRDKSLLTRDAARYLPDRDRWCPVASEGAPSAARDAVGVWTGSEMIVWGGDEAAGDGAEYAVTGHAYTPP